MQWKHLNQRIIKKPQEYDADFSTDLILNDSNKKEENDPRFQAMFKRSRLNNMSIFMISQNYNKLPKGTIRATGNKIHIIKPNSFLDIQNSKSLS